MRRRADSTRWRPRSCGGPSAITSAPSHWTLTFALAWAQLSRAHTYIHWTGVPTIVDEAKSLASAERALALSPDLPEGHLALGDYYNLIKLDWGRALEEYSLGRKLAPNNAELQKGEGLVARSQGRWEESQAALTKAQALDPRSIGTARRLTYNLLRLRRYPEALNQADRALALDRTAPDLYQTKASIYLAQGDLQGARAVLKAAERDVEPTELVAWIATYFDMFWVLNEEQQQLLLRLPPGPFNDDRMSWGLALAGTYALRGDAARAQAYGDSARIAGEAQLHDAPDDAQTNALYGVALAYAGRKADAIKQGERARRARSVDQGRLHGPLHTTSVGTHLSAGRRARKRRWTTSSRCSRSRTTSHPAGSRSIPRSIRSARTHGSRSCWRARPDG